MGISMPSYDKFQDTIPHLMLQHNDSHIHWASPIHGLPLELSFQNTTMASQQQILDRINPPPMTVYPHNKSHFLTNLTAHDKAQNE